MRLPSMVLNEIIVDIAPEPLGVTSWIFDARTGIGFSYISRTPAGVYGAGTGTTYVNGVQQASNSNLAITDNIRQTIRTVFGTAAADDVNIYSSNNELAFGKGRLYGITIKNAGVIVAQYDMSTGTVQDQSGNGRHATLTGGTWANDAPSGIAYTAALSDVITTSEAVGKKLTLAVIDVINAAESEYERAAKPLTDTLAVSDTIRKALAVNKSDAVFTAEDERESISRKLADLITAGDTLNVTGGKAVIIADNLTVSDAIRKSLNRYVDESVGVADTVSRNVSARLYDVIVTTESLTKQLPNAPTIIGTVALQGSREMNVYLLGTRVLDVTLRGEV